MKKSTQVVEFLHSVKDRLTVKNAAEELGMAVTRIHGICKQYDIKMLSVTQQNVQYILDMAPKKTAEYIARKLEVRVEQVLKLAEENNIVVTREVTTSRRGVKPGKKMTQDDVPGLILILAEVISLIKKDNPRPRQQHIKDKYTQTKSQYGLADDLRDIDIVT